MTDLGGIHASIILPMHGDGRIDAAGLDAHLDAVLGCPGIAGLLVNGHAGEGAALSREEARQVVRQARGKAGGRLVVAGVASESADAAAQMARDAAGSGADAIMAFAPFSWALGVDPRVVLGYHRAIHDATTLPLLLFQGATRSGGLHFPDPVLAALLDLPRVAAIKEGSWDSAAYDATSRLVAGTRPEVLVMASGDEHLFACMAAGSAGSLVSLAAVTPELVVALDEAVRAGDLATARTCHARIQPLAKAVYGTAPPGLATPRLKTCLHLLGRIATPACRAPLPLLDPSERAALADALRGAGVMT